MAGAVVSFVAHRSARRDVGPKVEQNLERRAVARLTLCEVERERPSVEINLEVDLSGETAPRATQRLAILPPLAPAAETCARTMVASNIWTQWAVWLVAASASKRASNTPARLRRQKRFQTEFPLPNSAGSARHVMVWTQKECSAPGTYGRFGLCRLGASTQPETPEPPSPSPRPSSASAWSASSKPTSQEAEIQSAGNQLRNLLAPIRPHGLALQKLWGGRRGVAPSSLEATDGAPHATAE